MLEILNLKKEEFLSWSETIRSDFLCLRNDKDLSQGLVEYESESLEYVMHQRVLQSMSQPMQHMLHQIRVPPQQLLYLLRNRHAQLRCIELCRILNAQLIKIQSLIAFFGKDKMIPRLHGVWVHEGFLLKAISYLSQEDLDLNNQIQFDQILSKGMRLLIKLERSFLQRMAVLERLVSVLDEKGFPPQNMEPPFSMRWINDAKAWLKTQAELHEQFIQIQQNYSGIGLPFEFSLPTTVDIVQNCHREYENTLDIFGRFDDIEHAFSELGWKKKWSPTERMETDITHLKSVLDEQVRLSDYYQTLRLFADSLGEKYPSLTCPFSEAELDALNEQLEFVDRWRRQIDSVRYRTLPWDRKNLPMPPASPTPESVMKYIERTRDLVHKGRWWYWVMTPIRKVEGILQHIIHQLRQVEFGPKIDEWLDNWSVPLDFTCGCFILFSLICSGVLIISC